MHSDRPLAASFRDPSGFLFRRHGVLYRQVNRSYREDYNKLMGSGLYGALVEDGLLLPHQEADIAACNPATAFKTLRPEELWFVSYPYEWSFSQLKDAALTTLRIQRRALDFGLTLKDSSAYNIQFFRGKPVLIDSLSFERYREGEPWVAYRQFCQHFLAPLALMAYCDVRLGHLLRVYLDGPPLDLVSSLLPLRTRLQLPLLSHIHLHAVAQRRLGDSAATVPQRPRAKVSGMGLRGLLESLESGIHRLQWKPRQSEWVNYYEGGHKYGAETVKHKKRLVDESLARVKPATVWDLGANTGQFSRLAADRGIPTVAFDKDPGAVERNYLECRTRREAHLLPLIQDLTNPSPGTGWSNQERMSLPDRAPADAILALALIHHLVISNNVPMERLARWLSEICHWLVIEFVPKSDTQVQRLLANREDIFENYRIDYFERVFQRWFRLAVSEKLRNSERRIYLLEVKTPGAR